MSTMATHCFSAIVLLALCLVLSACGEQKTVTGAVATVNGETIAFRDLEARRALLFSGRSPRAAGFDDAALWRQYKYVLGQIIEELLICQYMRKNGMGLDKGQLAAEEERIRDDYPPGAFEAMLLELAVDENRWREEISRRLTVEQFITQVLRPEISITADEVQQYYREHSADFIIPAQWHFMQIVGTDKSEVQKAGTALVAGRNATATQKEFLVTIHDINMGADMLPKELLNDLSALRPWQASRTKPVDDGFRRFVLVEKTPPSMLDAAEMSKRVEQALADEKVRLVYAQWIQKQMRKADIRIAPPLASPLSPAAAEERQAKPADHPSQAE